MAKYREETEIDPQIVVGLDIGTTKIATIIGYKSSDARIDVLGYGKGESTGVQHGLIFNLNKTIEGIITSINTAKSRSNQEIDKVFVGVAGRHIKSLEYKHIITRRNGKEEIIRQEEIDKMIEDLENISVSPGEKVISVIPQRFIIDGVGERETNDPVGELGERILGYFQIITGNEHEIRKIIRCINEANLQVKDIILEPIASALSCLTQEEKKQGVVLVDIGGGTTDVAIYVDGAPVFTRVIPFGGNVITSDIAKICQITEEVAEKLKTTYGTCVVEKSNKNNYITIPQLHQSAPKQISETFLSEIIYSRVQTDILNSVKKAIDESGYTNRIISGIVLTGGGAMLKNIKELCQFTLQKPCRIGIPEIGFVPSIPAELKHPIYATALGLIKYGVEYHEKNGFDMEENLNKVEKKDKIDKKNKRDKVDKKQNDNIFDKISKYVNNLLDNIAEKTS